MHDFAYTSASFLSFKEWAAAFCRQQPTTGKYCLHPRLLTRPSIFERRSLLWLTMLKSFSKIVANVGSGVSTKSLTSLATLPDLSRNCRKHFSSGTEESKFTSPLPFKILPFQSEELDAETLPVQDTSEFGSRLYSTIEKCKADGINSIFLKVPMLLSHYIPVAG